MKYENKIQKYLQREFYDTYNYLLVVDPVKAYGLVAVIASAAESLSNGEVNLDVTYLIGLGIICDEEKLAIPLDELRKSNAQEIVKELELCAGMYMREEASRYWIQSISKRECQTILQVLEKYKGTITNPAGEELNANDFRSLAKAYRKVPRQPYPATPKDRTF